MNTRKKHNKKMRRNIKRKTNNKRFGKRIKVKKTRKKKRKKKQMRKSGAVEDTIDPHELHNILILACWDGSVEDVRNVIWTINATDIDIINNTIQGERTPLFVACLQGHVDVVKELLGVPNIDVNKADVNHVTPLLIACLGSHSEVIELLLNDERIIPQSPSPEQWGEDISLVFENAKKSVQLQKNMRLFRSMIYNNILFRNQGRRVMHEKYRPGGPGALLAEKDFNFRQQLQELFYTK